MLLAGFTAMASQIIYMRELLVVFYGNELSISFILASWLIAGAIGSAFFGRFSDSISLRGHDNIRSNPVLVFCLCQIMLGMLIPFGIIVARLIKSVLHVNPGQILPVFPIMAMSFLILAPVCMTLGFIFSLGCSIYGPRHRSTAAGIGNVYILEAVGSLLGGALTSVILVRLLDAFMIACIFLVINILGALFLVASSRQVRARKKIITAILGLLIFIALAWFSGGLSYIDKYSLNKQWQGYDLVASKNSVYGNIAIVKKGEEFSFFESGLHMYTIPDAMRAEEATHIALLEHPGPKDILLIGGGVGGLVEEILKEPVRMIDYVELDPLLITMAQDHLPEGYYKALKDSRVSVNNVDGRSFVKTTKEKYDCVIVSLGDPYTAALNRYYTVEFFREVSRILKDGGILSFSLTSSENYLNPPLARFLSSVYKSLNAVFKDVIVMPGQDAVFLASNDKGALTYDYKLLEARTRQRDLSTKYVRDYYLYSKLSPQNISYINKVIRDQSMVKVNRDFNPSSYYYGIIFQTTLFRDSSLSRILESINERIVWQGIGLIVILLTLATVFFKRSFRVTALAALASGGFSAMAFQILILLSFQAMHGYLFYKLGMILTAFMAGLAIGAIFAVKAIENIDSRRRGLNLRYGCRALLMAVQGDFLLYSLILPVFFLKSGADILFPAMSVIAGFIAGSQFPLVNKILLEKYKGAGIVGGLSYGVDLAGSFFGALFTGVLLVPVMGILKTCIAIAVLNLAVLLLLVVNVRVEE